MSNTRLAERLVEHAEAVIRNLNRDWQKRRYDNVAEAFHEDAVLMPPDLGEPIVGRDAIVQTYRDFARVAELHSFTEDSLRAHAFTNSAVVHLFFSVDYTLDRRRYQETGFEAYQIERAGDAMLITWRYQTVLDAAALDNEPAEAQME